jgi:hypothetical protein
MTEDGLTDEQSAIVLIIMLFGIEQTESPQMLRRWGEENAKVAGRLTVADRDRLRSAYVARRDLMVGERK